MARGHKVTPFRNLILIMILAASLVEAGLMVSIDTLGQVIDVTKVNVTSLPSRSRELRLLRSFPTEDDEANGIFLTQALSFSADSRGRIYVSDVKANQILVFKKDGRFVVKIGRQGQGPGEFNLIGRALMTNRGLAVLDRSNARIQYFDDRGQFVDSSKLTKTFGDMAVGSDGTVYAISIRNETGKFISAIDSKGQIKSSFGFVPEALNNVPKICFPAIGSGNELFVAFWFYPLVQVYSPMGELLSHFEIQYRPMQERLDRNKDRARTVPGGARAIGEDIINAIDTDDNGFYILYRGKRIEILEFRRDGSYVKTYWTAQQSDYYPKDLIVLSEGEHKVFCLLQVSPNNRIDVFGEK